VREAMAEVKLQERNKINFLRNICNIVGGIDPAKTDEIIYVSHVDSINFHIETRVSSSNFRSNVSISRRDQGQTRSEGKSPFFFMPYSRHSDV
jgi:hypothetical protein